jgi:hypothetical protein
MARVPYWSAVIALAFFLLVVGVALVLVGGILALNLAGLLLGFSTRVLARRLRSRCSLRG